MFITLRPWAAGMLPAWAIVALRGVPMLAAHLALVALFWLRPTMSDWILLAALVVTRGFAITGGYHRYFSHRSYKTSRVAQFLLAAWGCTLFQMGPLWWAAHHRKHHRHSDGDEDLHSPRHGFLWSHFLWAYTPGVSEPDWKTVRDFSRYPELRALEMFCMLPGLLLAGLCWLWGGASALVAGFCLSTVVVYFLTNSVNSFGHLFGPRPFDTRDDSRNNPVLGYIAMGDGWHNNHHHYPRSANHGFYWWQSDTTFQIIRIARLLGVVWDVKRVPLSVLREGRKQRETQVVAPVAAAPLEEAVGS